MGKPKINFHTREHHLQESKNLPCIWIWKAGKKDASESWLHNIYYPIINEFEKLDIFEYFPFKNSVGLYVDIMTHKYYISSEAGEDIGIEKAIRSYSDKYDYDSSFITRIKSNFEPLRKLFY